MNAPTYLTVPTLLASALSAAGSDFVRIDLKPSVARCIGGVVAFDRNQFVTIHESPASADMSPIDHAQLRCELDVRYGRNGGLLSWQASRVPADPRHDGMPDVAAIRRITPAIPPQSPRLASTRWDADLRQTVLCTHPELMHGRAGNNHTPWGPRTYGGAAEFTAQFLRSYFSDDSRPRYLEVFNEPFVKAKKIGATIDALSEQHNHVARRVRELCPDVLVGGYSAAWVELELNNFQHWGSRQKRFMDVAGDEMNFFSYHIYDGVNVTGEPRMRTGSNSEAIMDLIDTYSHMKFGVAKPILITEYGGIPEASMSPTAYDAKRTAGMLYSLVGQLMTFMDHPDRLAKVIPYILGKAEWTYTGGNDAEPGDANVFLLWRRDAEGNYVETDLFKFYGFLRDLGGQWRYSRSDNPDVRVHLLADGPRLVLMVMNLDHAPKRIALSGLENVEPASVMARYLYTDGEAPVLGERRLPGLPGKLDLRAGAALMVIATLTEPLESSATVREERAYATECIKGIEARRGTRFTFPDVPVASISEAFIRVSSGRPHGLSKVPKEVRLNGEGLIVPSNWAGGEQDGRKNFYGMIEVAAPAELVRPDNVVDVVYPDSGGSVASVVLQLGYEE